MHNKNTFLLNKSMLSLSSNQFQLDFERNFRIDLVLAVKEHKLSEEQYLNFQNYIKSVKIQSNMKIIKVKIILK